jgi:hypothetical protein
LRANTRAAPLYSVGPMPEPDHEAIIRFGGKAPKRRAHSNERFDDHVLARVTTTSDRDWSARRGFRRAYRNSVCCACYLTKRSGCLPQHDAIRNFAGGDHASEGDEQLAGECDDHQRTRRFDQGNRVKVYVTNG